MLVRAKLFSQINAKAKEQEQAMMQRQVSYAHSREVRGVMTSINPTGADIVKVVEELAKRAKIDLDQAKYVIRDALDRGEIKANKKFDLFLVD